VPAESSEVIYVRKPVSHRMWLLPVVLWVGATIVLLLTSKTSLTTFQVVMAAIIPGTIFGVWLLTLYSLDRYGAIRLDRETLRVGRDTVPVASLDPAWVRMLATKASPGLRERVLASAATFAVPGAETADRGRGRLLGGAYGATIGTDLVTLRLVDGSRVSAPTRDRQALLGGLLTALDG
jgi:hypothetical protein